MKTISILAFLLVMLSFTDGFSQSKKLDNVFYPFNNALRLPNAPESYDAQLKIIKNQGYDGVAGKNEDSYFDFRKALDKAGLEMPETYIELKLEKDQPAYNPQLKDLIRDSKDLNLLVTLHLHSEQFKNNKDEGDQKFAEVLIELADFAASYHVKLAIYPHYQFYCESFSHALELAKRINRPNFGVVFNLCHYLKLQGSEKMYEEIENGMPHIFMVSICGANSGDTKNMEWDQLIQPLGKGSFDTFPLIKFLKDNGYNERFGLQTYAIKTDFEETLSYSMKTWKDYQKRYKSEK